MRFPKRISAAALAACALALAAASSAQAYVYWSVNGVGFSGGGTMLGRADLDGSAANHSFVTGAAGPNGMAVDAQHIYWTNSTGNSIGRANLDGGSANQTFISGAASSPAVAPASVAVDPSHVYWTTGARYLGRANLDGTGSNPKFIDVGSGTTLGLALSAGTIYFTKGSSIYDIPAGSSTPALMLTLASIPTALSVADGFIYWTEDGSSSGSVGRALISDPQGTANESFVSNLLQPLGLAVSGNQLYWSDHGSASEHIGRAQIGASQATNVQLDFISEPGGPLGLAADPNIDPTRTTLTCAPAAVPPGSPSACTASVTDSASPAKSTGSVVFSSSSLGTFFSGGNGNACVLTPAANGATLCTLGAVATSVGTVRITASYPGDGIHSPSSASATVCTGTSGQCSTNHPPPPPPRRRCVVPKLKHKSLSQARKLLSGSHCSLGKAIRPHARRGHRLGALVIVSQQPSPGKTLLAGTKVNVRLGPAPPRKRRHR